MSKIIFYLHLRKKNTRPFRVTKQGNNVNEFAKINNQNILNMNQEINNVPSNLNNINIDS